MFAVHVSHQRVFEWSREGDTWQVLPDAGAIEDPSDRERLRMVWRLARRSGSARGL